MTEKRSIKYKELTTLRGRMKLFQRLSQEYADGHYRGHVAVPVKILKMLANDLDKVIDCIDLDIRQESRATRIVQKSINKPVANEILETSTKRGGKLDVEI